jgi:hypothetical protein
MNVIKPQITQKAQMKWNQATNNTENAKRSCFTQRKLKAIYRFSGWLIIL